MSAAARARVGRALVALTAVGVTVAAAVLLWQHGTGAPGLRAVLRMSARVAAVLLGLVTLARPAQQLLPSRPGAWLLAQRRALGLSVAVTELCHALAVAALSDWSLITFWQRAGWFTALVGGTGFLCVLAMAVTSFRVPAALLGRRRWRVLHTAGIYYVTAVFLNTYLPAALSDPAYLPVTLLLLTGPALRLVAWVKRRRAA